MCVCVRERERRTLDIAGKLVVFAVVLGALGLVDVVSADFVAALVDVVVLDARVGAVHAREKGPAAAGWG